MRRIAAHYIYWYQLYRMYYIELNDDSTFNGIYPLNDETARTEFYDGILLPVNEPEKLHKLDSSSDLFHQCREFGITENVSVGNIVYLYRIHNNKIFPI